MREELKIQIDEIPAGKGVQIGFNNEVDQNCSWIKISSVTSKSLIFGNLFGWHSVDSIKKDNNHLGLDWEGKNGIKEIFDFRIDTPVKRRIYKYIIKPILFPLAVFAGFWYSIFRTSRLAYY